MVRMIDSSDLEHFRSLSPALEPVSLLRARDDAFRRYGYLAHFQDGTSRVTASVNPRVLDDDGVPVGCIGNLVLSGRSERILDAAHTWLRNHGSRTVRGPIVRHTWYPFRAVTSGFENWPALAGEPWNAADLPRQLDGNGYAVRWTYLTTRTKHLMPAGKSSVKLQRFIDAGFRIRPLDLSRLNQDLTLIHQLIQRSFAPPQNTMFVPIDMEEFLVVLGVLPQAGKTLELDPKWIQLCFTADGTPAGFIFLTREGALASIKTLCVAPEYRGVGVGGALVALAHKLAHVAGVTWVAHTLMADEGPSMSITAAGSHEVLRRYAVFERSL